MSMTIAGALRLGLACEMERDERVFVMGEDVGIGGSFQFTRDLVERFGPGRVRNTPVAEAGFVGLGIGAAIGGMRPVIDFQYGDFLLPAADQIIQQACKLPYMSGGQFSMPLTLHAPTGASGRAAQHATSVENLFHGVPGLQVVAPATTYDAKGAMTTAIRSDRPVLVCSHKHLYGSKGERQSGAGIYDDVPREPYELEVGRARVTRAGRDVTIVSALLMAHRANLAADALAAEGVDAEVIDLRWLSPLDLDTVVESAARTGRLVVVEEGSALGGWGGSVIAGVVQRAFDALVAPPRRLTGPDHALPAAPHLEAAFIPSVQGIAAAVRQVMGLAPATVT